MPRQLTNLLLLFLVAALAATGLLGWMLPRGQALPLYDLHRVLGVALLLTLLWKQVIVRQSLRRRIRRHPRDGSVLVGLVAGLALLGCTALGLAWTLNLVSFDSLWGYSALNLHVYLGLALLPFFLWHVLWRWERHLPVRRMASRRSVIRVLGLSAVSLASWQGLERTLAALAADAREPSGSKHAGSFSGNAFPVTNWLFDPIPALDAGTWRLEIAGKVARPGSISYRDILSLPRREVRAVLDCTGGWWSEQSWHGVSVGEVVASCGVSAEARWLEVISTTGHRWTFPLEEATNALLATHVGGEVLTPGHGYPVRLVAPGRRGFQWVKWVGRLEVI